MYQTFLLLGGEYTVGGNSVRKDSIDNDSSSSSDANEETIAGSSGGAAFLILPSAGKPAEIFRGIGMIAKVVSDSTGIIWWLRKPNHYKSVWFHRQKTFKYGLNLHDKSLKDYVKEGERSITLRFFFKFVSRANCSHIYPPTK